LFTIYFISVLHLYSGSYVFSVVNPYVTKFQHEGVTYRHTAAQVSYRSGAVPNLTFTVQ